MNTDNRNDFSGQTQTVIRGAFVNLIGNVGKFSHFGFDLVAARLMGQQVFGYYSTTWLILHLSFIVCYFGAHRLIIDAVVRSKAERSDELYRVVLAYLFLSFTLSFLLVAGIYLFAGDIARALDKPPIEEYLKIVVWSAPFYCATTIFLSATRGLKIMRFWVIIRMGFEPFSDFVMISFFFFALNLLTAPFLAKVVSFFLGACLSLYIFQKYFSQGNIFKSFPDRTIWKRILSFGFPVMSADFLSVVTLRLDIIPLSILAAAPQVAIFQVILNIGNIMRNLPQAIDPIMMPLVVEMKIKNDMRGLENTYATLIRVGLFLSFGFFILISLFGDLLLSVYGAGFTTGAFALIIVVFGIMINVTFSSIEPVLVMSGYAYLNLFNNLFFVTINLIIDFLLIPSYGILGAAVGSLSASLLTSALQVTEIYVVLKLRPLRWSLLLIVVYGFLFLAVFSALEYSLSGLPHFIVYRSMEVLVCTSLYLFTGWKWFFTLEERALFRGVIKFPLKKGAREL